MDLQTLTNLFATTYNPDPNIRKSAELQIRKVSRLRKRVIRIPDRSLDGLLWCRSPTKRVSLVLCCRSLQTEALRRTCMNALSMLFVAELDIQCDATGMCSVAQESRLQDLCPRDRSTPRPAFHRQYRSGFLEGQHPAPVGHFPFPSNHDSARCRVEDHHCS